MSNSNTTQETLEIMKESEKKLVEESVNKNKFISKTPSKEDVEKEGEENGLRQETQDYLVPFFLDGHPVMAMPGKEPSLIPNSSWCAVWQSVRNPPLHLSMGH
uniref:R3H domain containing 2 n=1 Tax=Mus musculus TaxID=10090 RepID=E9Q0F6_MOUSE